MRPRVQGRTELKLFSHHNWFWISFQHFFSDSMFKTLLIKKFLLQTMSQTSITSFFKSPKGTKRKHEEVEMTCNDSNGNRDNHVEDVSANERAIIISMAKSRPALSPNIGLTWFKALEKEFSEDYFRELSNFLVKERKQYTIYPPEKDVYSWTNASKICDIKVVILGQDPYHGPKQAHGLAFSVRKGVPIPKSLINIYSELKTDIPGFVVPAHGCLYGWATQGVLLLNACLTVRAACANSHQNKGWEHLTDAVISWIDHNLSHVVFMLWGRDAREKAKLISKKHLVLAAAHPSPLSAYRGFFGCKHFSKANKYLCENNKKSIDWQFLP